MWIIFTNTFKNTNKKKNRKILLIFDDMIADMVSNEKLNAIVTEAKS